MPTPDASAEHRFRWFLTLDGVNLGKFAGPELDLSSEVSEDWDPEYGPIITGGTKTGDDLALERPWIPSRDRPHFKQFEPRRGVATGHAAMFEVDDVGQPTSSEPLIQRQCRLTGITVPASSGGSDAGKFKVTVRVSG